MHLLQELEAILSPAPSSLKQPSQRPGERETGGTGYLSQGEGRWGWELGGEEGEVSGLGIQTQPSPPPPDGGYIVLSQRLLSIQIPTYMCSQTPKKIFPIG